MLKTIRSKILLVIALTAAAIGGYFFHEHEANARAAAQTGVLLQQGRRGTDAAKEHDDATWEFVRKQRQNNDVNPTNGSRSWTHYVP